MSRLQEKQAEFLRVLRETGSAVKAREAVGVGSRAVRKWQEDASFLDQYNDAVDVANDAIRGKVREMALEGSESMLALSMKVIEPALRPAGTQVAVGVQVNGRDPQAARIAAMSDDEKLVAVVQTFEELSLRGELPPPLLARLRALPEPAQALKYQSADVIDVEPVEPAGATIEVGEDAEHTVPVEAPSGPEKGPSVEDLL